MDLDVFEKITKQRLAALEADIAVLKAKVDPMHAEYSEAKQNARRIASSLSGPYGSGEPPGLSQAPGDPNADPGAPDAAGAASGADPDAGG